MEKKRIVRDGHIHSPYCPHGSNDSFEMYVEKAIEQGLEEMTFTEHMPFPGYFMDNKKFLDECNLKPEEMVKYLESVSEIKKKYIGRIKINIGAEVDFIDGYEEKITQDLNLYGPKFEDSILSTHFIKVDNEYMAIDCTDGFERAIEVLGNLEKVYDKYYETLLKAVKSDLGKYKPRRIGHPNLIRRFAQLYPFEYKNYDLLEEIAKEIKKRDYEVDVNTAGLRKEGCGEIYVDGKFKEFVEKYDIRQVYGSDSHSSEDVARDFNK